ncbi:glycerol kinase GlpK [soil metagenome]
MILALDQGTTTSRALVFDRDATPLATAQREFAQHFPQPGWVEHDPHEIWECQLAVAEEVLVRNRRDIAAIGITNQRETTVVWERSTGQPLYPAIVWQDRRTAKTCHRLEADGLAATVADKTGLIIDPYFAGTKIAWILDHVDGARRRAGRGELAFGTIDSWLLWKLTGGTVHATDTTNAARTLLFNTTTQSWDSELLAAFDVPAEMMPAVLPSSGHFGEASIGGPLGGLPVTAMAGDQHAALFGQACFEIGTAKNTYGTGCFVLMNTGHQRVPSRHRLLSTVAWQLEGEDPVFALEGSIFIAGAVVQWLRDGLGLIAKSSDVEELAASVPDTGGVYFVPAFAGLGAPHWNPDARGSLFGISRGTTAGHIARAAVASMAFQTYDVLQAMRQDAQSHTDLQEIRVDGGASANADLMQLQANLLGVPVVRSACQETTALGAAFLAGLPSGFWPDLAAVAETWKPGQTFDPDPAFDATAELAGWARAVAATLAWASDE